MHPIQSVADIKSIAKIAKKLPTQTVRSEDQLLLQQFSTPADMAALCQLLAQPQVNDIVMEPSAGNGLLVAQLPKVKQIILNEYAETRRNYLEYLFPEAKISGVDAALLTSKLSLSDKPSLILMNPPFVQDIARGADRYACVRHLRSAIAMAAPYARIIVIMPDWFTRNGKVTPIYDKTFRQCSVRQCYLVENGFIKHGTSIAVRIYVIDKAQGINDYQCRSSNGIAQLLNDLQIIPRPENPAGQGVKSCNAKTNDKPNAPTGIFALARKGRAESNVITTMSKTDNQPANNSIDKAIAALQYQCLDDPRPNGEATGCYLSYRPSRVVIENVAQHPGNLVESIAMGSIASPKVDYQPQLPNTIMKDGLLSEAQLKLLSMPVIAGANISMVSMCLENIASLLKRMMKAKAIAKAIFWAMAQGLAKAAKLRATF